MKSKMNGQSDLVCQICLKLGIEVAVESEATHIDLHLNAEFDNSTNESQDQMHNLCFPVQESKVVCDDCDMEFSSKSVLEDHMVTEHFKVKPTPNIVVHPKIKSLSCGSCGKKFKSSRNRVRHEKAVHLKLKPFLCQFCQRSFSENGHRIRHEKIVHMKEKGFSCRICHKSFSQNSSQMQHERVVHMKEKGFSCRICHKEFGDSSTLKRHERTVHMKEKRFSCEICRRKFGDNSHRIRHEKNVHSVTHPTICSSQDKTAKLANMHHSEMTMKQQTSSKSKQMKKI